MVLSIIPEANSEASTLRGSVFEPGYAPKPDENGVLQGNRRSLASHSRRNMELRQVFATGPGNAFNPTNARFRIQFRSDEDPLDKIEETPENPEREANEVAMHWSSRYNRKGRNSFVVHRSDSSVKEPIRVKIHRNMASFWQICKNFFGMFFKFPYWDMAFWSGWSYSWGSVLFVIDGAFGWTPIAFPWTKFSGEDDAVGFLFFFGALLYELGATLAYLEAINDGSFHGSAMKRFLEGRDDDQRKLLDEKLHAFFGNMVPGSKTRKNNKKKKKQFGRLANAVDIEAGWMAKDEPRTDSESEDEAKKEEIDNHPRRGGVDLGEHVEEGEQAEYLPWRWWPTWQNFKDHHVREIGWWACSIQLFGATLYAMTGIVALPGILDTLEQWQENACYWIPQIVASCCFLTASLLFTVETQEKWYKPEPRVLGWWIGFWASVGSCGFLLCGALGPAYGSSGAQYQSALSSMWGSFAYLLSGLCQWYEAVNKHPIEEIMNEPGEMKSYQVHPV